MYQTMIDTMAELKEGDYESAMDELIELVRPSSEEILSALIFETSVWGVKLQNLITKFKSPKDFAYLQDLTLRSVFGKKWVNKIFEKAKYIPAAESEEKVDTYVIKMKSCPFCYPASIPPQKLGKHHFGKFLALTIQQMVQIIQDFFGNEYQVVTRETACFHSGDAYGEIRVWLYPSNKLALMQTNPYIQQIK